MNFLEFENKRDVANLLQLRGLRGCYEVNIPLFFAKIALCGSYGTDLREGVTVVVSMGG